MRIDITCSTDDNYVQHCMAMLCSLYANNTEHTVYTHLLHPGLSEESKGLFEGLNQKYDNIIIFYEINDEAIKDVKLKENSPVTIATYYRLLLPDLLDNSISKVLYLDCDVIVLKDISELFTEVNMDDYGVAAVKDNMPYNTKHRFVMGMEMRDSSFCAGVMLINLDFWRLNNSKDKLMEFSVKERDEVFFADQDALNYVFRKNWYQLPYQYGHSPLSMGILDKNQRWTDYMANAYDPSIIHYAAHVKPWFKVKFPEREHYWKYLALSGYPSPQIISTSKEVEKKIKSTRNRYYINRYVRPFVPDIIEIILSDVLRCVRLLTYINSPKKLKSYTLKCWLRKYGV